MRIALINPQYPYGKDQIFLGGSVSSIGARLLAMGHDVHLIDLNIDRIGDAQTQRVVRDADTIGISLTGSPYIPGARSLVDELRGRGIPAPILLGGQGIARLPSEQFNRIIGSRIGVVQIRDDGVLAAHIQCEESEIPTVNTTSFIPAWKQIGEERMTEYLRHESTLVFSQGCKKSCKFCAARKGQAEIFREIGVFEGDLRYLAGIAQRQGLSKLEFYATNLDFFQNPLTVAQYLRVLARVRNESGIDIRVRCLACMDSFIEATEKVENLGELLRDAGLYWIGFGVDGADPAIWRSQYKAFNKKADIVECMNRCQEYGVLGEILMVLGFPEDNARTLAKSVAACIMATLRWSNARVRPYLAKLVVPGNDTWALGGGMVEAIVANPELFYNLDFAAVGSSLTHPRTFHRWACNVAYLFLWVILWPFNRCNTSPLLPQGQSGFYGRFARWVNGIMPYDR